MSHILTTKYWFGDMVYLVHCPEQLPRMITDINFEGGPDKVAYGLVAGSDRSLHYESELRSEPDKIKQMGVFNDREKE